jgi:hypothetical protein
MGMVRNATEAEMQESLREALAQNEERVFRTIRAEYNEIKNLVEDTMDVDHQVIGPLYRLLYKVTDVALLSREAVRSATDTLDDDNALPYAAECFSNVINKNIAVMRGTRGLFLRSDDTGKVADHLCNAENRLADYYRSMDMDVNFEISEEESTPTNV